MKTLKEITGDSLEQMIDYKVVDQDGDSVGTLHSLWSDPTTGAVEFLGVKTGWLFGHNHVVPAEKAELDETENVVRLPYTSLFVKEAPSMSADAEISEEEEETIYRYYGLEQPFEAPAESDAEATSANRLRKTVLTGAPESAPGEAVHDALDSLVPGDSSAPAKTTSAVAPASFGTANLYGSTGTVTPVAADSAGADASH